MEPSKTMCNYLRWNVLHNHLTNVFIVRSACGAYAGTRELMGYGPEMMNSLYEPSERAGFPRQSLGLVRVTTLADLFRSFEIQECAWLKLDCEGAEYEILLEAPRSVLARIKRISAEYHPGIGHHGPEELADFLRTQGFRTLMNPSADEGRGYLLAAPSLLRV